MWLCALARDIFYSWEPWVPPPAEWSLMLPEEGSGGGWSQCGLTKGRKDWRWSWNGPARPSAGPLAVCLKDQLHPWGVTRFSLPDRLDLLPHCLRQKQISGLKGCLIWQQLLWQSAETQLRVAAWCVVDLYVVIGLLALVLEPNSIGISHLCLVLKVFINWHLAI